jgi:hypothetical protein
MMANANNHHYDVTIESCSMNALLGLGKIKCYNIFHIVMFFILNIHTM